MKLTCLAVGAALTSFVLAAPNLKTRHARHEQREESSRWIKRDAVEATRILPMRIGLTQSNLDRGHDLLMEVSDPKSSKYGKYYTVEEVYDLFAPSTESVAAVRAWLAEAGIALERVSQSTNKQWLQFDAESYEVEELLKAKYHYYEHELSGGTSIGCDEYHVKANIQHHIDYITPGIKTIDVHSTSPGKLARRIAKGSQNPIKRPAPPNLSLSSFNASDLSHCDTYITPACIMAMYDIPKGTSAQAGNELGIFEEVTQSIDHQDLNTFFADFYPDVPKNTFPIVHEIDGAVNQDSPKKAGIEAVLDFEISYPLIYPQNSVLFITDTLQQYYRSAGLLNTFLDAIDGSYCTYSAYGETGNNNTVDPVYPSKGYEHPLQCGVFKPTNVISISYGIAEMNEGTPANYMKRQCSEYMKLGMQGVSIVFADGDNGVSSYWGCSGTRKQPIFNPDFPASCPYITSVGATTLTGSANKDVERATTYFSTGGGFSNYFPRPSYQEKAVAAYFKSPAAPTYPYYTGPDVGNGFYNRSGRGFPDVAAIGQAILNYGFGQPYLVDGTSASAPVFASILNRINEERLKAGKAVIGFVNPTLYQNPQAFHDIVTGDNAACGTQGFKAGTGWDPVSGLGTPIYPALLEVFMNAA